MTDQPETLPDETDPMLLGANVRRRGFRPNALTAALAAVLVVAVLVGMFSLAARANQAPVVEVATSRPFTQLPSTGPFHRPTPVGYVTPGPDDATPQRTPLPTPTVAPNAPPTPVPHVQHMAHDVGGYSDVVVLVTLGPAQGTTAVGPDNVAHAVTLYSAKIDTIILQNAPLIATTAPGQIVVEQEGGTYGTLTTVNPNDPAFVPGEQDVLFLMYDDGTFCYNPVGRVQIVQGPTHTVSQADADMAPNGTPLATLEQLITG